MRQALSAEWTFRYMLTDPTELVGLRVSAEVVPLTVEPSGTAARAARTMPMVTTASLDRYSVCVNAPSVGISDGT